MRVIFAGTPEFASTALAQLHRAGHSIALVLTQPDRPAGRGMKLQASAVKQFALAQAIPVAQPRSLRLEGKYPQDAAAARLAIAQAQADVMVVAAYGLILPQWLLDDMSASTGDGAAKRGCLNIHGSLLPRWRGAAPIHRAIEAGDLQTGITIMQMDAGLDTGDMLLGESIPIDAGDTTASLHDRLADLGSKLIVQALDQAAAGLLKPVKQSAEGVTYARKIEKHEAMIDWCTSAQEICRRVRAFNPFPIAKTSLGGEDIKVWAAHEQPDNASTVAALPGTIVAVTPVGIAVQAMNSIVILTELQRPGGRRLPVADWLHGFAVHPGMCLGAAD